MIAEHNHGQLYFGRGVCVAACPWTKPRKGIHRITREIACRKVKAGWWMSRAERLAYGRFRPRPSLPWYEVPEPMWKKYKTLAE